MSFVFYDLTFLAVFCVFVVWFLYKRKSKLGREGWMFLYRTQVGVKFIGYIGEKYKKTLKVVQYFTIATGYVLMASMIYLLVRAMYIYATQPQITQVIKAPPLVPLVPYFTNIFGLESFFPPFYFTYFIVAILIVAVVHEFSHGIFMKLHKVRIKSTGFAFLGPFIGAFVEQDEKQMNKKPIKQQLAILSAGVFANIIAGLVFLALFFLFCSWAFAQIGAGFQTYVYSPMNTSSIIMIENYSIQNPNAQSILSLIQQRNITGSFLIPESNNTLIRLEADGKAYLIDRQGFEEQLKDNRGIIVAYDDMPAINAGMKGIIFEFDGQRINNNEDLSRVLGASKAGDKSEIKTKLNNQVLSYQVTLAENPSKPGAGFLGIASAKEPGSLFTKILIKIESYALNPGGMFEPKYDGELMIFLKDLLYWIMIINLLVGIFNMLPLGILDGGRFFFLTILGITKRKKWAEFIYKAITKGILLIFLLIILFYIFSFFRIV